MEAGRELDALVAEHVMEWPRIGASTPYRKARLQADGCIVDGKAKWFRDRNRSLPDDWKPSERIEDAWVVVDMLTTGNIKRKHPLYFKCTYRWWYPDMKWPEAYAPEAYAVFDWKETGDSHPLYTAAAETMPLAICLAALRAVGYELPDDEELLAEQ